MQSLKRLFSVRRLLVPVTIAIAALVAACGSDASNPTGLKAPDQASLSKSLTVTQQQTLAQGLMWSTPQPVVSATKLITPAGGTIELPAVGLQVQVPKGAVAANITITVTTLAGNVVAYDFQPHGTVFNVPLKFVQDLQYTNFAGIKLPKDFSKNFEGGYFLDSQSIDQTTGLVAVSEFIPATDEVTISSKGKYGSLSFPVRHFSGYLISVGRR
ncbi:MAG: hypothetical protein ABJF01_20985 [bacterium]